MKDREILQKAMQTAFLRIVDSGMDANEAIDEIKKAILDTDYDLASKADQLRIKSVIKSTSNI